MTFSLTDLDGDGVMEWARYIEVDGQVRLLFVAEWQFVGGKGYETFLFLHQAFSEQVPMSH